VLGCGLTTLLAVMYNLISDVVGGVEIVVLEETLAPLPPASAAPAPPVRRPALSEADIPTEETPITTPDRG
jgi:hypothetical protein